MTLGHKLKPLDFMIILGLWKNMNNPRSWAQGSRHYEQL